MNGQTPGSLWAALRNVHVDGPEVDAMQASLLGTDDFRVVAVRRGGMGEVFICESRSENADRPPVRFALKTFQKKFFFDSTIRIAFLQEATTWARLTGCLHIMPNLGMTSIDRRPAVRMMAIEPEDGEPLTVGDMLRGGALSPEEALAVALQTALGMREATTWIPGLIHGDLKPENLLVKRGTVWITDFGLARVFDPRRGVLPLQSTYNYQAPEVFDEPEGATPKADIYSFGLLLYELLTGRRPVDAGDRTSAAEAHRMLNLDVLSAEGRDQRSLALGSEAALAEALSRLAISCAAPEPADRPADFAAVFDALHKMAGEYDLVGHFDRMIQWRQQKATLDEVRRNAAPQLVQLLFDLHEFRAALSLLEDLDVDTLSPALTRLRGVALVLNGRVEEGLAIFEGLLGRADISASLRRETEVECALALKRLDRFDEAAAIFERLLSDAEETDLPSIVTNLATVYLASRDFRAAARLLDPFCSRHPEHAHAWANLGAAYAWLGDAERSLEALDRATSLNSSLGEAYVARAAVQMDLLNRPDLAYASLDVAFDQGFESRAWAVRMVVAATAIGRTGVARQILQSLKKRLGERVFGEIQAEVEALIADLRDETPRSEPRYKGFLRRAEPTKSAPPRMPAAPPQAQATGNDSSEFRMPFMNTRFYDADGSFSIDFYYPLEAPNYIERFREGLEGLRRQMAIKGLGSHLRTTPFFVTRCAGCAVEIMTNRDPGKRIRCRRCGVDHSCHPLASARAQELASMLLDGTGAASDGPDLEYLALALQVPTPDEHPKLIALCKEAGFRPLEERSFLRTSMMADGHRRGTFDTDRPVLGFLSSTPHPAPTAGSSMPPLIDQLIRRLRSEFRHIRSASSGVHPEDPRFRFDIHPEQLPLRIAELKELVARWGATNVIDLQELVELLRHSGDLVEAVTHARRLASARPGEPRYHSTLGALELQLGNLDAAIAALETTLRLDPADAAHMFMLGIAYEKSGNHRAARQWISRSAALGGPMNSLQGTA